MSALFNAHDRHSRPLNQIGRSVSQKHRPSSVSTARSFSPSPSSSEYNLSFINNHPVVLGVCAMDVKARSKPMREILTRIGDRTRGHIDIKIFGDKVILDEDVEKWPLCDVLICFFSSDFPLEKAVSYVNLRSPYCINDLAMQEILLDRRRLYVSRDGGPKVSEAVRKLVVDNLGIDLCQPHKTPTVELRADGDAIIIDGKVMEKPFVEKPRWRGRRLFRKIGNKSSDLDPDLVQPRMEGSYTYEEFIDVDNSEDIKVYTVGSSFTHAETRKSPVIDGLVRRNTDGKEIRFITRLTETEHSWASRIAEGFGQRVCGFDLLRCDNGARSVVVDVNGWSFVKGNDSYYDKAADILTMLCSERAKNAASTSSGFKSDSSSSWTLKGNVTVFRHADRTPKQKLKFNFPVDAKWSQPFVQLLGDEKEEIILRETDQLRRIGAAIEMAQSLGAGPEDLQKLTQLNKALISKIDLPGTKAQLKPAYTKKSVGTPRLLQKLQLVFKWGGEFTHAARYQSRDLGENMKKDILIMNREALNNVKIFTSSERRVTASAEIFAAALLDTTLTSSNSRSVTNTPNSGSRSSIDVSSSASNSILHPASNLLSQSPSNANLTNSYSSSKAHLIIRKDLLDDSNAAKDLMDDVKKRLKNLLRPGEPEKRPGLVWPKSMNKEPVEVVREVIDLLTEFRTILRKNYESMNVDKFQERWCCGDEPWLFRERWEKLFEDFCDVKPEKFDPSRVSELYDTIKYCALHHRTFLFSIFDEHGGNLNEGSILKSPDRKLHELYGRAKALFDLVAPQEYGIETWEKEEIGILTSLPLLRKIVDDLEAARNDGGSSLTLYFTKESHIHTLVNLVLLSGLPIANPRIPELDYCVRRSIQPCFQPKYLTTICQSHIAFELYERNGGRENSDKEYSIKLSLSEGAHSSNVLDSAVDARHSLNVHQRRKLTQHIPYALVIEKFSKHFHRLPKEYNSDSDSAPEAIQIPAVVER